MNEALAAALVDGPHLHSALVRSLIGNRPNGPMKVTRLSKDWSTSHPNGILWILIRIEI